MIKKPAAKEMKPRMDGGYWAARIRILNVNYDLNTINIPINNFHGTNFFGSFRLVVGNKCLNESGQKFVTYRQSRNGF